MPATFDRTLRALEADHPRRRVVALLVGIGGSLWAGWFLAAPVPVYEVAEEARLEVKAAAHPVAAQVDGRVLATHLAIGRDVRPGEVLVALDAEPERLALRECEAHRDGLVAQLEARRKQVAAEREAARTHRTARAVATGELRARAEEAEAR